MLMHKGTQTIETARLILRKAVREDAEFMFHNWASDPEVTKFLTWPTHQSVEITRSVLDMWIADYKKLNFYQWMIELKDLGEVIGTISVVRLNDNVEEAEVGYCIGQSWWRKGIVSEALKGVMGFLFDEIGVNRVSARHDTRNPNSGAVMKKCGMIYEGTLRSVDRNNQGICDATYYSILRSEWIDLKQSITT